MNRDDNDDNEWMNLLAKSPVKGGEPPELGKVFHETEGYPASETTDVDTPSSPAWDYFLNKMMEPIATDTASSHNRHFGSNGVSPVGIASQQNVTKRSEKITGHRGVSYVMSPKSVNSLGNSHFNPNVFRPGVDEPGTAFSNPNFSNASRPYGIYGSYGVSPNGSYFQQQHVHQISEKIPGYHRVNDAMGDYVDFSMYDTPLGNSHYYSYGYPPYAGGPNGTSLGRVNISNASSHNRQSCSYGVSRNGFTSQQNANISGASSHNGQYRSNGVGHNGFNSLQNANRISETTTRHRRVSYATADRVGLSNSHLNPYDFQPGLGVPNGNFNISNPLSHNRHSCGNGFSHNGSTSQQHVNQTSDTGYNRDLEAVLNYFDPLKSANSLKNSHSYPYGFRPGVEVPNNGTNSRNFNFSNGSSHNGQSSNVLNVYGTSDKTTGRRRLCLKNSHSTPYALYPGAEVPPTYGKANVSKVQAIVRLHEHRNIEPSAPIDKGKQIAQDLNCTDVYESGIRNTPGIQQPTNVPQTRLEGTSQSDDPRCNCAKSQCLNGYCRCNSKELYCGDSCCCENCRNNIDYEDTVEQEREKKKMQNPNVFNSKEIGNNKSNGEIQVEQRRGCNCAKSKCVKNYCDCYQADLGCHKQCRCLVCNNPYGRKNRSEEDEKPK